MTIEEKLYLLREMKENSEKNASYLQNKPLHRKMDDEYYDSSFSNENAYTPEKSIMYLSGCIKSFIFRCILCTMIFLGLYSCHINNNKGMTEKLAVLSNNIKEDVIVTSDQTVIQGKIYNTIKQILSQ